MTRKSLWALCAAIATTALVLVPSSLSASDSGAADQAAAAGALDSALAYVNANAADLGVTSADVSDLYATSTLRSAHSGVTHVNLNQRFRGPRGLRRRVDRQRRLERPGRLRCRQLRAQPARGRPVDRHARRRAGRRRGRRSARPGGARQPPGARGRRRRGRRLGRRDLGHSDPGAPGLGLHEGRPSPRLAALDRRLGQRVPLERHGRRRRPEHCSASTTGRATTTPATSRRRFRARAAAGRPRPCSARPARRAP